MRLVASDFYTYLRPSKCELRVYLRAKKVPEADPGPYDEVIKKLGELHETSHLKTFPKIKDLSSVKMADRIALTRNAISCGEPAIYQGVLSAPLMFNGEEHEVVGMPDFLIGESGQYVVRDSKLSRRVSEEEHPEIILQLGLYGWLFERMIGRPPSRLEVHAGTGEILPVTYDGGKSAIEELHRIIEIRQRHDEPYGPVGWSKCGGCGFNDRCWTRAQQHKDVSLVSEVDDGLARTLHQDGVKTVEDLLTKFNLKKA